MPSIVAFMHDCIRRSCLGTVRPSVMSCRHHRCSSIVQQILMTNVSCSVRKSGKRERSCYISWIISSGLWFTTSFLIKTRTVSSSRHRPIFARAPGLGAHFERITVFHVWMSCMVSVTLRVVWMRRSRSRVVRRVGNVLSHTHE